MSTIHELAERGAASDVAMATPLPPPQWDDILLLGAQLDPFPLKDGTDVDISVTIGAHCGRPLILDGPALISLMSFGTLSREA